MAEPVDPGLTTDERALLACGLIEWGGPAIGTDEIAWLIGFSDLESMYREGGAIADAVRAGEPLSPMTGDGRC